MKYLITLSLASVALVSAGSSTSVSAPAITAPAVKAQKLITPTLDIRSRYEFGDVDKFDPSHAFTLRERVGLKTKAFGGFSALVEGEFTQALIDDYAGGFGSKPNVNRNTVIADPRTSELNQAFLQYAGYDSVVKLGRQRIVYDNAAFIGNVGWRQNEQTYDAASIVNKSIDKLTVSYAYVDQVNRIFGSTAGGIAKDISTEMNLLNVSYAGIPNYTLGGYVYLMEFDGPATAKALNNDTYGISAKTKALGLDFYGELATQEGGRTYGDDSGYAHFTATKALGKQSLTFGIEHLSAGFRTPLATLHAFNGFADVLLAGRFNGSHGGITNPYISHTMPVFYGMKWTNVFHIFGDNSLEADIGYEYNSVLVKKFNDSFTAIAKFAHFETESKLPTTTRFTAELNYTF